MINVFNLNKLGYISYAGFSFTGERLWTFLCLSFTHMLFKLGLKLLNTHSCMKLIPLFLLCDNSVRIVASLRLKNERGERLSSHRSDHVTGVWEGLHNLCNFQRNFPHLGVQQVQVQLCYSFYACRSSLLASFRSILCWYS